MVWNPALLLVLAVAAVPVMADREASNCQIPKVRHNVTAIQDADNFCTMFPPKGVSEVAPSEACATSVCYGNPAAVESRNTKELKGNERFGDGVILSAHYVKTDGYTQITGCMNSAKWDLNPVDGGGQMDSHGWLYRCDNNGKFMALVEPSTNTYCIRCCKGDDKDPNCNTGLSTKGCWALIPGVYTMADGSDCPSPASLPDRAPSFPNALPAPGGVSGAPSAGAPSAGAPSAGAPSAGTPSASVSNGAGVSPSNGAAGSAPTNKNVNSNTSTGGSTTTSAGARSVISFESVAILAAGAMALVAF